MNLLKIIKNNLFIQNFVATIVSFIPPYLENSLAKYQALKKAFYVTAHDRTDGNYLEFGVFTGSSFNFAIKANKKIEKIFGSSNCRKHFWKTRPSLDFSKSRIIVFMAKKIGHDVDGYLN